MYFVISGLSYYRDDLFTQSEKLLNEGKNKYYGIDQIRINSWTKRNANPIDITSQSVSSSSHEERNNENSSQNTLDTNTNSSQLKVLSIANSLNTSDREILFDAGFAHAIITLMINNRNESSNIILEHDIFSVTFFDEFTVLKFVRIF